MKKSVLLASLCLVATSYANLIGNGSFESGQWSPDGNDSMQLVGGSTNMTDWTVTGDEIA